MSFIHHDKSAYSVVIQLTLRSATTAVRFPCQFSVHWHTNNQKVSVQSGKHSSQTGKADINEQLLMRTEVAFDRNKRLFLKKETQVQLNLISKSRPDQSKLVGRVTIDLANILNEGLYTQPTEFPLQFCSVNGSLVMFFRVLQKAECDISLSELQLSCGQGPMLSSALKSAGASFSIKESPKKSVEISQEIASVSKNDEIQQILKKEVSLPTPPFITEATSIQQIHSRKDLPFSTKDSNQLQPQKVGQKSATNSFKSISAIKESIMMKKSHISQDISQQITEAKDQSKKSSFKKLGSISSEEGKFNDSYRISEDFFKQKLQIDRLRMEADRYRQQAETYKLQLQKVRQDTQLTKMELKQKKSSFDQSTNETNNLKVEYAKLKDQLSKSREESVSLTLKLAQLRQAHNKVFVQSSFNERQLAKFENLNEKYQALLRDNSQFQSHTCSLQSELANYQSRCQQLELEKTDLTSTLSNLDQMHQEALSKCTEHEQALNMNKGSFETEMRTLKQQLKEQTKRRLDCEKHILQLNEEVERQINVANQFDEARHSWQIAESLAKDQNERKSSRVRELEENMISLDERVRWLEGQNELMTENSRKNRDDYIKLKAEKEANQDSATNLIKKYEQTLQQLNANKTLLQKQLQNLQKVNLRLQQQCNDLKNGNDFQTENIIQLQTNLAQIAVKNNELEELVLSLNELRDREQQQNLTKERNQKARVAQLEGNNHQLEELHQVNLQRVAAVEEELRNRENLIMRLQQGLRTQVERSEQLNNRVMYFIQKEERMKETLILLEIESRKVHQLLIQQKARQAQNQAKIQSVETKNAELTTNLQESLQYGQGLQDLAKKNETNYITKIQNLSKQVEALTLEVTQSKLNIEAKNTKIKELEQQFKQYHSNQFSKQSQATVDEFQKQIVFLESSLQTSEGLLVEKQFKIEDLEALLQAKQAQLTDVLASVEKQTSEFQKLCNQLKENQLNHENQFQQSEQRYLDILSKYRDLQNNSAVQQQMQNKKIEEFQQQINDLKTSLSAVTKENTATTIASCKEQIIKNNEQIKRLEQELKSANFEVAKVPNLERSLKIKSIELNSLKFKNKADGFEGNELLRLKDEQISDLVTQRDRFLAYESQYQALKQTNEALAEELELIQEQKFNIESQSNARALQLEEAREENKKLMDQITIIGERNGQLQRTLQEILNKQQASGSTKGQSALRAQILLLKGQVKELDQTKQKVYELQQTHKKMQQDIDLKEEEHMIALIDQQFKLAKTDSRNENASISLKKSLTISNNDSKQIPNLANTYKQLKDILDERIKYQDNKKLIELIEGLLSKTQLRDEALEKLRLLSKEFQKFKVQILKSDGKGQQKLKIMSLFKNYESMLGDMIRLNEVGKN